MRPTRPLAALLLALGLAAPLRAATPARPNVLFIAVDDLNATGSATSAAIRRPRRPTYDRLARMGTAFTRAYCAVPVCEPSRAALMSGMRASTTGLREQRRLG
jgi:arylsulfatase A-like enzyme